MLGLEQLATIRSLCTSNTFHTPTVGSVNENTCYYSGCTGSTLCSNQTLTRSIYCIRRDLLPLVNLLTYPVSTWITTTSCYNKIIYIFLAMSYLISSFARFDKVRLTQASLTFQNTCFCLFIALFTILSVFPNFCKVTHHFTSPLR